MHKSFQESFGVKLKIPLSSNDPSQNLFDKKFQLSNVTRPNTNIEPIARIQRKPTGKSVSNSNQDDASQLSIKYDQTLKEPIKALFNYMFNHFASHLMENSIHIDASENFKSIPKIIKKNKILEQIQTELVSYSQIYSSKPSTTENLSDDLKQKRRQSVISIHSIKPCRKSILEGKKTIMLQEKVLKNGNILDSLAHESDSHQSNPEVDQSIVEIKPEELEGAEDKKINTSKNKINTSKTLNSQPKPKVMTQEKLWELKNDKRLRRFSEYSVAKKNTMIDYNQSGTLSPIMSRIPLSIKEVSELEYEIKSDSTKRYKEINEGKGFQEGMIFRSKRNDIKYKEKSVKQVELSIVQLQRKNYSTTNLFDHESYIIEEIKNKLIKEATSKFLRTNKSIQKFEQSGTLLVSPKNNTHKIKRKKPHKSNFGIFSLNDNNEASPRNIKKEIKYKSCNIPVEETSIKRGVAIKRVESIGGDIFDLKEGTVVTVDKVDTEDNIATCSNNGLIGLFPLECIKIIAKN